MIQNLVWATAYNLVAIPVAAGVFVHWGLDLPMSVGAVAMRFDGWQRLTAEYATQFSIEMPDWQPNATKS